MIINGEYIEKDEKIDIINPYNEKTIDTVPIATTNDVKKAIISANNAKDNITEMSAHKVSEKLYSIFEKLRKEKDNFAKLISQETGKPIKQSIGEMDRSIDTLKLSAEESKRIYGETVPIDA